MEIIKSVNLGHYPRMERIAENQKFDCKKCMDLPQTENSETEQPVEIK